MTFQFQLGILYSMEKFSFNTIDANKKIKQDLLEESRKTDPTKSSLVSSNIKLGEREMFLTNDLLKTVYKYKDKETGEKFYSKEHSDPRYDYFVALLAKGILNVSDVIEHNGKILSREINLNKIKKDSSKEEIEAEFFILHYLFGDRDHNRKPKWNFRVKEKKFTHFDYGTAFTNSSRYQNELNVIGYDKNVIPKKELIDYQIRKYFNENLLNTFEKAVGLSRKKENIFLKSILEKTELFIKQLENYDFFNNVIEKSKIELSDHRFSFLSGNDNETRKKELYQIMKERLFLLKELLNEKINKDINNPPTNFN